MQNMQQAGLGSPLTITFISMPTEHKTCCASIQTGHLDHHHHLRTWPNLVTPLLTLIPMTIKSSYIITSLSNQNTTITSLSNLVAHLVKLIPGGREERLFGLLAEWHKAWKLLVLGISFPWCILGFPFILIVWLYVYYIPKVHIYLDVLGLIY